MHREQNQRILQIVYSQWGTEVRDFMRQWFESLQEKWGFNFCAAPDADRLAQRVGEYMEKWNLSPLRHSSYDQVRRAFSKLGCFTTSDGTIFDLRLESEKLDDLISSDQIPMETFEQRQDLAR